MIMTMIIGTIVTRTTTHPIVMIATAMAIMTINTNNGNNNSNIPADAAALGYAQRAFCRRPK